IISTLLESANNILEQIEDLCQQFGDRSTAFSTLLRQPRARHTSPSSNPDASRANQLLSVERVCLFLAPAFAGLLRGMVRGIRSNNTRARMSDKQIPPSIISALYPSPTQSHPPHSSHQSPPGILPSVNSRHQVDQDFIIAVFPQFQSVIPHSLSHSLMLVSQDDENERLDVSSDPFGNMPNGSGTVTDQSSTRVDWRAWNNAWLEPNGSEYLFGQVASVYAGRLPHRAVLSDDYLSSCLTAPQLISLDRSGQLSGASEITSLSFTSNHMKALLKLSTQLMSERFLKRLDSTAAEFWPVRPKSGHYPYRSFAHCLRLCWLLLIRDLLHRPSQEVSEKILSNVQTIMLEVYANCISELSRLSAEATGLHTNSPDTPANTGRRISLVTSANALSASLKRSGRPRFSNPCEEDEDPTDPGESTSAVRSVSNVDTDPSKRLLNGRVFDENNDNKQVFISRKYVSHNRPFANTDVGTDPVSRSNTQPTDSSINPDSLPSTTTETHTDRVASALFSFDLVTASTATCIQILTQVVTDMAGELGFLFGHQYGDVCFTHL
ncbi:uncharacterized protein DEA37_0005353, partial [Paragonimus westermani]